MLSCGGYMDGFFALIFFSTINMSYISDCKKQLIVHLSKTQTHTFTQYTYL